MLGKLFGINKQNQATEAQKKREIIYRNLLRREAQIGGELFGPVKRGGKREFFCLDDTTWIWHEEWIDEKGQRQVLNTRYDVRPTGILKAQNGQGYQMLSLDEANNLYKAAEAYCKKVSQQMYSNY